MRAQQQRWDESLVAAEQLISRFPMSTYAPLARYASAWANQNLGKLDQSLVAYRALADSGRTALAARSRLMEGEILFEQGKHREAVKTFFKVAYGFGERAAPAGIIRGKHRQLLNRHDALKCLKNKTRPDCSIKN